MTAPLRVVSWNINGLRAAVKKGFTGWLSRQGDAIVAVQETRATEAQIPPEIRRLRAWHRTAVVAERKGYSGVTLFARRAPDEIRSGLGDPTYDVEGRWVMARYGALWVANAYFPNGNGTVNEAGRRTNDRVPYKLGFDRAVKAALQPMAEAGERVLLVGDFNTAHAPIDLARPKDNGKNSGFLPEERASVAAWLERGWQDSFRDFHPEEGGHYSWWATRNECRRRNIGWRIDYVLASPAAAPFVSGACIHRRVTGSDHCPVSVELRPEVLRPPAAARGRTARGTPGASASPRR